MFLLGDFNIDLILNMTNDFLDSFASISYVPYIIQLSQRTSHSRTLINLINNIFSNLISKGMISGNLTATISDPYHNS